MRDKQGKTFVLIDGYTLAIAQSDSGVLFSGCHSRKAISRYDDSLLIQFLARHADNNTFWQCFQAREMYENEDNRFFVRDCQQLIGESSWKLPQGYQNWAIWELIDQLFQIHGESYNEPICLWHPGSYYPMYGIPYDTAFKVIQVARNWRNLQEIEGIELLNETQWNLRFASAASPNQPLLIPQILSEIEEAASIYLLFFAEKAQLYTPNQVAAIRSELLHQMAIANLLNREISPEILARLVAYPNLQRCVIQAEKLWRYLDGASVSQEKNSLCLDWMFFDPPLPEPDFYRLCLEHFQKAKLQYPYTILFEADGKQYRLVTGNLYPNAIALLTVLEITMPINPNTLFTNVNQPTYLELVVWASQTSCLPPVEDWEMSVDWRGREDELVTLGTDPSLPQAEFFLNCLASHLARLWQNGVREATPGEYRAALKKGLLPLHSYFPKETYFLYCRGQMLLSGELRFNYGEWFDGGFLRLFRAEQAK
ncbi:hypothetical protein [Calothrix sp. PCC 6303]|uniref:hypothetical protein n=1 Tax=Calothrix sp. PCC 6303 TaxID=1170562 RepID=UPI0002A00DF2|nr:hypothetical protein [Calothrix sp. PCC 6303]AFZ01655.1 hypothetical protein Cal6303_2682 [Calothrix sp. PCC 6303]